MDPLSSALAKINEEVEELEAFADDFAAKMDAILKGDFKDESLDGLDLAAEIEVANTEPIQDLIQRQKDLLTRKDSGNSIPSTISSGLVSPMPPSRVQSQSQSQISVDINRAGSSPSPPMPASNRTDALAHSPEIPLMPSEDKITAGAPPEIKLPPIPFATCELRHGTQPSENQPQPCPKPVKKHDANDYSRFAKIDDAQSDDEPDPRAARVNGKDSIGTQSKEHKGPSQKKKKSNVSREKLSRAVKDYCESIKLRGNSLFHAGKYMDAVEEYTTAISIYHNPPRDLFPPPPENSGSLLAEHRWLYELALPSVPVDPALLTNRALCWIRLGRFEEAIDDLSAAIERDPTLIKAYWKRCEALRLSGRADEALADLEQVAELLAQHQHEAEKAPLGKKPAPLGITIDDIDRTRRYIKEIQRFTYSGDLGPEHESSIRTMQGLLQHLAEQLKDDPESERAAVTIESIRKVVQSEPLFCEHFRLANGFNLLLSPPVLCVDSLPLIMPIFVDICRHSFNNQRILGLYIEPLVQRVARAQQAETTALLILLLSQCSQQPDFVDALYRMNASSTSQFGARLIRPDQYDSDMLDDFPDIPYYGVRLLTHLIRHRPNGPHLILNKWKVSVPEILGMLGGYIQSDALAVIDRDDSEAESVHMLPHPETLVSAVCECIHQIVELDKSSHAQSVHKHGQGLVYGAMAATQKTASRYIQTRKGKGKALTGERDAALDQHIIRHHLGCLLTTACNILTTYSQALHDGTKSSGLANQLITLLPTEFQMPSLFLLSKLLRFNRDSVGKCLDGWWDEVADHIQEAMAQAATLTTHNDAGGALSGYSSVREESDRYRNAAAQLLAAWLMLDSRNADQWIAGGGGRWLASLIVQEEDRRRNWMERHEEPTNDLFVGNLALCLAECTKKASHCAEFAKHEIVRSMIHFLRFSQSNAAKKNMAIACSRLCGFSDEIRAQVRKLDGMELLHKCASL
ncbi:uncharacterized protein BJ171DRAFT_574684 [Polychytrium aggregatum]|uniref:uncharacterized protein n=1 Tax=Polychytrium aggregatum TaxID=110093 RepID=UPI0022FF31D2|nr:uncharacterized protein BJ171DRAFT_574684 [Polychytrium aggregatum]KAI9190711.1 hypothetical protein BJ171DRAFT_574684 [Polychytrium aggregatum]